MKLAPLATLCAASDCPTVYRTDRGTVMVQGYAVADGSTDVTPPVGELLVEVPAELLAAAARMLKGDGAAAIP